MKKKNNNLFAVVAIIMTCILFVSCSTKKENKERFQEIMEVLDNCQKDLESCLFMEEVDAINVKLQSIANKETFTERQYKIIVKKCVDMIGMAMIKSQIINKTNSMKVTPTREEMQELSRKCFAIAGTDRKQIEQLMKEFWETGRN